jgi:hypothetical protein
MNNSFAVNILIKGKPLSYYAVRLQLLLLFKKEGIHKKMRLLIFLSALYLTASVHGQVIIVPVGLIGASVMPEHGFLPGKKFTFYSTLNTFDFKGSRYRVELTDARNALKLKKIQCSELEFTNTSEFASPGCIYIVGQYIDTLFNQSGAVLDTTAIDTVRVRFDAIDARLIGFGSIRVHGLCQMSLSYHDFTKTYCIDITDADAHSPISPNAFVTRQTATRIMASASIREVIEQILVDLKSLR